MKVPSAHLSRLPSKASRWIWSEMRGCAAACVRNSELRSSITPKPRFVRSIRTVGFRVSFPTNSGSAGRANLPAHFSLILHTQENLGERDRKTSGGVEKSRPELLDRNLSLRTVRNQRRKSPLKPNTTAQAQD